MEFSLISSSNLDITETLRKFANARSQKGLDVCFIVPTHTGLKKSILDATADVQKYLKISNFHDYDAQQQGPSNKVLKEALIFSSDKITNAKCSMYRPETKNGDPRIWFSGLGKLVDPTDLLAITIANNQVIVINCSKTNLDQLLSIHNQNFWQLFPLKLHELNDRAAELLYMLNMVASKGYVQTLRSGDTGIGFTLETMLGIKANSSEEPDYKGIELKSTRNRGAKHRKINLYGKVPNWKKSRLKSSKALLDERGYYSLEKQRHQLFHTFDCISPNSLKMMLKRQSDTLHQIYTSGTQTVQDVQWDMTTLENTLMKKHSETFWVFADTRGKGKGEEFHFSKAKYTSGPDPIKLGILLESGAITIDYTITETKTGAAKDQGYLFKIKPNNLDLLFNTPIEFDLGV